MVVNYDTCIRSAPALLDGVDEIMCIGYLI